MIRPTLLAGTLLLASLLPAAAEKCTLVGGNGVQVECVQNVMQYGSNGFATSQATATTTATQVLAARNGRNAVTIENTSATAVYLGPAGVTAATGFLLPGTIGATVTLPVTAALYAVTATGTATLAFVETY